MHSSEEATASNGPEYIALMTSHLVVVKGVMSCPKVFSLVFRF